MSCHPSQPAESRSVLHSILLAEDDAEMRALLSQALREKGYVVTECNDGAQLLLHLSPLLDAGGNVAYDLVISDIRMPALTGLEIVEGLTGHVNCPPMILITAFGDQVTHESATRCGVAAMLDKPFEIGDLLAEVDRLLGVS
jgi:DNA-binding response OmpR family regulator